MLDVAQTISVIISLAERGDDQNVVTLSTLHAAKGLEWPHVILASVNEGLLPFRSGLYRLASARPQVELVPVWIDNLNRVLPKGEVIPLPLLCTVTFGTPLGVMAGEESAPFRERSRAALLALAPAIEEER